MILLACAGEPDFEVEKGPVRVEAAVDVPVLDPKLGGELHFSASVEPFSDSPCSLSWSVANPFGQERQLEGESWDGRDDAGVPFDPGEFAAVAIAACEDGGVGYAVVGGWIARLGPAEVDFVDGADEGQVDLAWHKLDLVTRETTVIDEATPEWRLAPWNAPSELDDDAGEARAAPAVWTNPDMPPWAFEDVEDEVGYAIPAAYAAGSTMRLRLSPGATALSARSLAPVPALPSGLPALQLVADGWTPAGSAAWVGGAEILLDSAALEDSLGREDLSIRWRWQVQVDGVWLDVPGSFESQHRVYRTAGPPRLRDGTELGFEGPIPWIGTLEDLNEALDGVPADDAAILDAIRDWLHHNDWIYYDPSDSSYSSYQGSYIYWDYTWSELGEWLDRSDGIHLYCHSVSCLLSVLSGSVGVYAPQQVLGVGFTTNLVRAAGTEAWVSWAFNSHSVVSPDDGLSIWDASIAMDGDEDPMHEPVTEVQPMGLSLEDYLALLSPDEIGIVNSGLCYVEN